MPISIRNRLLILALLPVILMAVALFFTVRYQTGQLVDKEMASVEASVTDLQRKELKELMDMTYASIKHIYERTSFIADTVAPSFAERGGSHPEVGQRAWADRDRLVRDGALYQQVSVTVS